MNDVLETIQLESKNGFNLQFQALIEDLHSADLFDDSIDDINEICQKIDNYDLVLFTAKVSAFKNGIELASDYLGGNLYSSYEEFINARPGYIDDMEDIVINEAKEVIKKLLD